MLSRRDFLRISSMAGIGCLAGSGSWRTASGADSPVRKRPNMILLMTDDQGYGDLGCHGNPVLKTPHLDRLYAESVRLTNFHVNPFCAPTRASLMVGKVSDRIGVRRTLNMRNYLPTHETTMADVFKANGYRTGLFGKWHLGHNAPYRPIDRGFDEWFGIGDCGLAATSDYWGNDRFGDHYRHNGRWEWAEGFNTDVFFDRAMQFMHNSRNRPFFVYLPTNVPHFPWNVRPEWRQAYRDQKLPVELDNFYASIERVDKNVGRLRRFLAEEGLADNTILVFLTDNGTGNHKNIYNASMRQFKGSVYEGGHRVPCFIHWPAGTLGKARDIDTLTAHFDLLPTLAELCSLDLSAGLDLDGRSLVPLLRQSEAKWEDRAWVLHSQNGNETPEKWTSSVVLTSRWRLINGRELYDIQADPSQRMDVAAEHPDVVERLRRRYEEHWDRCGLGRKQPNERPIVGASQQEVIELGPDAWMLDPPGRHIWWQGDVRLGKKLNGFWPVRIARTGSYRLDVRRWPAYLDAPITGIPAEQRTEETIVEQKRWRFPECRALPVAAVRLEVNGQTCEKKVAEKVPVVSFDLTLKQGPADIRATFLDKRGEEISGAYFVYIRRG